MKKTLPKKKKTAGPNQTKGLFVNIDYPKENETILPGQYSVRVSAPEGYAPEISVGGGPWISCRDSAGFWWHDWDGYGIGSHTIEARIRKGKKLLKKVFRSCECGWTKN